MENLVEFNDKLLGAPGGVLVFFVCVGVGYVVKVSRRMSNDWLPLAVTLTGVLLYMGLAPTWTHDVPVRTWLTRNFCVGFTIGIVAWISHKTVLRRFEKKLMNGHDTEHITKDPKE